VEPVEIVTPVKVEVVPLKVCRRPLVFVAAEVILDNLSKDGRFSRRRVGVALPPGLRKNYNKDNLPR
jgi:hypothetical protein